MNDRMPQLLTAPPAGFTSRPASPEDARAIHAAFVAADAADGTNFAGSWEEYAQDLSLSDFNPLNASRLVLAPDGTVAAAAWFFENIEKGQEHSASLQAKVHPLYRHLGLGTWLVSWFECAARGKFSAYQDGLARRIRVIGREGLQHFERLTAELGFLPERRLFKMRSTLEDRNGSLAPDHGFKLEAYTPALDETIHQLIDTAFRVHPNYQPHTAETWALHTSQSAVFRPQASFLARVDGQPAGAVICSIWEEDNQRAGIREGFIDILGVLGEYRLMGIGRALMLRAMDVFRSLGMEHAGLFVASDNPTGAVALYESLGFQPVMTVVRWVKVLA